MKSLNEMDLEEWELLPDEGFLEINDDGGKKIYSRKYPNRSATDFQMNYFICPQKSVDKTGHQLLPVTIDLESISSKPEDQELMKKEGTTIPVEIKIESFGALGSDSDQDPVSQVFFKKMKENEFVDMKVESPKSSSSRGGIMPQMDFQFEEKGDSCKEDEVDSEMVIEKLDKNMELDDEGDGLNIWKWSLTGIGAICSFGVAAATFCIISFSTNRKKKHPQLQFQIYTNDKRMKQVRLQVPITRAHITVGGYYDASL